MFDFEQCVRCLRLASSFHDKTLAALLECLDEDRDAKVAAEYQPQWKEAQENLEKLEASETLEFGNDTEVAMHSRTGYRMSMKYGFMSIKEFGTAFGVDAKHITALKPIDRYSQCGTRLIKGIAFTPVPGDEYKYRILEQYFDSSTFKDKALMQSKDRLRERQPEDVFTGTAKAEAVHNPAAFTDGNHRA
jgi:hypothetical protein